MIITLARECGCQGDLIGQELAKMYQLPFYDRKKVSDLIRSKGTLDRFPDFYGENPVDTLSYSILLAEDDQALYKRPKQALGEIMPEDDFILLGRCGKRDRTNTVPMLVKTPARIPRSTARQCLFKSCHCSYKGIARQTVAGVKNQLRYLAPAS